MFFIITYFSNVNKCKIKITIHFYATLTFWHIFANCLDNKILKCYNSNHKSRIDKKKNNKSWSNVAKIFFWFVENCWMSSRNTVKCWGTMLKLIGQFRLKHCASYIYKHNNIIHLYSKIQMRFVMTVGFQFNINIRMSSEEAIYIHTNIVIGKWNTA